MRTAHPFTPFALEISQMGFTRFGLGKACGAWGCLLSLSLVTLARACAKDFANLPFFCPRATLSFRP